MAKKRLLAYPIINEIEYRSNIDSRQLDEMLKSIENSILRTIIKSTELATKVDTLNLGIVSSYNALYAHEKSYSSYPSYASSCFATAFSPNVSGGRTYQNAGIVTLDWDNNNKQSKIPIVEGVLSPNLKIYVDDTLRPQDDDVYNTVDFDPTSFWIENATAGIHTIEIQVPPGLSKRFNYLEIVPFPIFGIEITKIEYTDTQSVWQTVFDSEQTSSTYLPYRFYNNSGPIVLHLSPKEYNNSIKITYKVKDGINAMGFSKIDIGLIDYYNTATTILIPFENLPNETSITPTTIDLDFYVDITSGDINQYFSKNGCGIYITNNNGSELESISPIQGPQTQTWASIDITNGLWLKIVTNEVDMTSLVFRGCKLEYTT